jgi:hypothetical protein
MNGKLKAFGLTALLATLTPCPANAQTGTRALDVHGGFMLPALHAHGPETSLGFDQTPAIGATLNFWLGEARRWGIVGQGTWSGWHEWQTSFGGDFGWPVTMWMYDVGVAFRLLRLAPREYFVPYVSLGVGGVMVNPSNNPKSRFPTDVGLCANGGGSTCDFAPADAHFDQGRHANLAAVASFAIDWFMTPDMALRLEIKDYWTMDSPYRRLSNGVRHDGGNNFLLNAGFAFYMNHRPIQEPGFSSTPTITPPPTTTPPPHHE